MSRVWWKGVFTSRMDIRLPLVAKVKCCTQVTKQEAAASWPVTNGVFDVKQTKSCNTSFHNILCSCKLLPNNQILKRYVWRTANDEDISNWCYNIHSFTNIHVFQWYQTSILLVTQTTPFWTIPTQALPPCTFPNPREFSSGQFPAMTIISQTTSPARKFGITEGGNCSSGEIFVGDLSSDDPIE